ncbi:MAG: histidine kinase [Fimbriimonadaceae bacterium]|nr:histidine kinase [Fimbriimonadaceae bacterium]
MRKHRFSSRSASQIQTKLVKAYVAVTFATLTILLSVTAAVSLVAFASDFGHPDDVVIAVKPYLPALEVLSTSDDPARVAALVRTMDAVREEQRRSHAPLVKLDLGLVVVGGDGRVLAASPRDLIRAGAPLDLATFRRARQPQSPRGFGASSSYTQVPMGESDRSRRALLLEIRGRLQPAFAEQLLWAFLPAFLGVLGLGSILAYGFGQRMARRWSAQLEAIHRAADAWSLGQFDTRIPEGPEDEFSSLARRLNGLGSELSELLRERERSAAGNTRAAIARDLHDTVKQHTFAASLQLAVALRQVPEAAPGSEAVRSAQQLLEVARRDLAEMIVVRPGPDTEVELAAAMRERVDAWQSAHRMEVQLNVEAEIRVPMRLTLTVLRIMDEALANVERHSRVRRAEISLRTEGDRATLRISDAGIGFDPPQMDAGMGLANIAARARQLPQGTLEVHSRPGSGTTLLISWEVGGDA